LHGPSTVSIFAAIRRLPVTGAARPPTTPARLSRPAPSFDESALRRVEHVYRRELAADPGNAHARISLAWCLLVQALLRAGQESVLDRLGGEGQDHAAAARRVLEQDAGSLLGDCLRQTLTVQQLSTDPQVQGHAERIQALVRLSGGDQALRDANEDAAQALAAITRELRPAAPRRSLRRRPRRPASSG
jgi:hypothetical protein